MEQEMNHNFMDEVTPREWVKRLTIDWSGRVYAQQKFLEDMITGIVGSGSARISDVARFLNEPCGLKHTHKRLSRQLNDNIIEFEHLRNRLVEMNASQILEDDVIAFDPGDITKPHATVMEYLHRVHDGSSGECEKGYEDIAVEVVRRTPSGAVFHLPLYQKLASAKDPAYISQNRQILDAIQAVYQHTQGRGIFSFDRGHDRSRIYEKALLPLKQMRWILRLMHNRSVHCSDARFFDSSTEVGVLDLAARLDLSIQKQRAPFERKTSLVHVGFVGVELTIKNRSRRLSLVVVRDPRNKEAVMLLTTLTVSSCKEALQVWAYYLDRWGKEEGYRLTKQALGMEKIRSLKWDAIQNHAFLVWLAYGYLCWVYKHKSKEIREYSEMYTQNFRSIDTITYTYYRVQKVLSQLLSERRTLATVAA